MMIDGNEVVTDLELRDMVYQDLYRTSEKPEFKFKNIIQKFEERQWRYDNDLESDLVDELYKLSQACGIKWYKGNCYIFDGKIYVEVQSNILMSAFKLWCTRIGLKLAQKRKAMLFKEEFLEHTKISNHLIPRLDIVAFKNGVLSLSDCEFHPFSPDYHVTYFHPYRYDPKAKCKKWRDFLKQVLPDKLSRTILQMYLGLGLIERGTVYRRCEGKEGGKVEICLLLVGTGANGKSVIYETAMGLFGKNRISGLDYNELTMPGDEGMRARVLLRDAIFNWSSDVDPNTFGKKRTGTFKRIVSGEPVTDRVIGGNVKQNYDMPYLIFNLNDLPDIDDGTLGFMRRLQIISFDVTIPAAKQNKRLALDLRDEYSGIFNWVMRGMKEVRRRRFVFPDSEKSKREMLLMQMKMNPVVSWVNAYGIRTNPDYQGELPVMVPTKYIVQSVEQYCEDNDAEETMSVQRIGTTLGKLRFVKKRMASGFEYKMYGITIDDILNRYVIRDKVFIDDPEDGEEETYIEEAD